MLTNNFIYIYIYISPFWKFFETVKKIFLRSRKPILFVVKINKIDKIEINKLNKFINKILKPIKFQNFSKILKNLQVQRYDFY